MRYGAFKILGLCVVLVILILASGTSGKDGLVQSCTVTVQPGQSIRHTIAFAASGAVICLSAGIWQENLEINKSLTLRGAGRDKTILKGLYSYGAVIRIGSQQPIEVLVENLAATDADLGNGLQMDGGARVTIRDSAFLNNGDHGIFVFPFGDTLEISGSVIKDNKTCGVWVFNKETPIRGTYNEMRGNGADLCGFAPASLRKPLVSETDRSKLTVPGDYANLQEAVDALTPGGTITVAAGTYETGITIWKPLTLRGAGTAQSVLKALPEHRVAISIIPEAQGVIIEGLTVTGSNQTGLVIFGNATLQGVQVSGNASWGLWVLGTGHVSLTDSQVSGNGFEGLWVVGSASVSLTNSQVSGNSSTGLVLWDSATAFLATSTVSGNGGLGIVLIHSAQVAVWQSTIESNAHDGIAAGNQSQVTIINSVIRDNGRWGVEVVLKKCGWDYDDFTGKVEFRGNNTIEGNHRLDRHPWDPPGMQYPQVCVP